MGDAKTSLAAEAEAVRLAEAERRDRESLRQHWEGFCDADPVPEDFIDRMDDAGFVTLRKVTRDDLNDAFAAGRGIEKGGWVWVLTDLGQQLFQPEGERSDA